MIFSQSLFFYLRIQIIQVDQDEVDRFHTSIC
jgi:hypothetical protein